MNQNNNSRPFYFYNVFWGKVHRQEFLRLCISSLLAPKNLPSLVPNPQNRYLIATTKVDWVAMQEDPLFLELKKYIRTQFIEMPRNDKLRTNNPLLYMSAGHKIMVEIMYREKAWGIQTTPDSIFNDGFVSYIQDQVKAGKMLVLCPVSRFEKEGVNAALEAGGWRDKKSLTLSSRDAVKIALKNMHSECLAANYECDYFWISPVYTWWEVPEEEGVVMHSMSWSPILMPYFALNEHSSGSLDNWTIDGNYVHENFNQYKSKIAVVDDSDDAFILSVTPKENSQVPLTKNFTLNLPFSNVIKCGLMRRLYFDRIIDPLKREIYLKPIKWHSRSIKENKAWSKKITEVDNIISFAIGEPPKETVKQMGPEVFHRLAFVRRLSTIDGESVNEHKYFINALLVSLSRRSRLISKVYYHKFLWKWEKVYIDVPYVIIKLILSIWANRILQWPIIATKASLGDKFYRKRINKRFKKTYPFSVWFLHRDRWKKD